MASRYGGGSEDFNREAGEIAKLRRAREELAAKEATFRGELAATEGAITSESQAQERRTRVLQEQADVAKRVEQTAGTSPRVTQQSTRAIEENTAARRRNAQAIRQQAEQSAKVSGITPGAFRGARDPLFAEATARGLDSQYALRRALGVGQGRAANLQAAVRSPLEPGAVGATAPLTRQQAAVLGVTQADAELEEAKRRYAAAMRRKSATDFERVNAYDEREDAKRRRRAAIRELQTADEDAAARTRLREEQARAVRGGGGPGAALVPRTPANAGLSSRAALPGPAFGEYPYAPIGREQIRGLSPIERPIDPAVRDRDLASRLAVPRNTQTSGTQAAAAQQAAQAAAKAQAELNIQHARAVQFLNNQADAEQRTARATKLAAVEYGTASQAMRRHGALTSEFIAAAARGETTMRELAFQTTATIGKFAGWSIAASAVYGAVGAVHQLGTGAIQAQAGVHQLDRVINGVNADQASQAFRDLAGQFNVPIEVASDAVYRMGQRFHNLPDAVEAAKSSLFSFKTGEVDVATSTENLLAVVNGFGLSADQLTGVYDQINQAQNTFGIRIGETEAGLAKAAGTYRNAGGDLNTLLAVFVAISRATNRSGQEIGTGISRGVQRIREPGSQKTLRQQGVDVQPDNFQATLLSAMQAARQGADVQALAAGLLGNQYARLLTGVLRDQSNFNAALRDTSPAASQNSAQKELAKVLKQVNEQAARVGVNLQRLGATLADSHALDFLGAMLKALNGSLEAATTLVDVFNKLPDGVQQAVVYLGEAALLLAAMRRFGPANIASAERFPALQAFQRDPDTRLQTLAVRGQRNELDAIRDEREALTRRRVRERLAVGAARLQVGEFDKSFGPDIRSLPEADPRRAKLVADRIALEEQVQAAERQVNASAAETNQLKKMAVTAERELVALQKMHRTEVAAYLAANQIPIPLELDTPSARGAGYVGGLKNPVPTPTPSPLAEAAVIGAGVAVGGADAERIAREAALAQEALGQGIEQTTGAVEELHKSLEATDIREQLVKPVEQASQVRQQAPGTAPAAAPVVPGAPGAPPRPVPPAPAPRPLPTSPRVFSGALESMSNKLAVQRLYVQDALQKTDSRALNALGAGLGKTSASGQALKRAAERTAALGDRGVEGLTHATGAIKGAGGAFGRMSDALLASFGPLDALIAGFFAFQAISNKANEIKSQVDEGRKALAQPVTNKEQYQQHVEELRKAASEPQNAFVQGASYLKHPSSIFHSESPYDRRLRASREAATRELARLGEPIDDFNPQLANSDKALRARDYASGAPVHHRFLGDIKSNANKLADEVTSGVIGLGEFNDQIDKRIDELYRSRYINRPNQRAGRREIETIRRSALAVLTPTDFSGRFDQASPDELRAQLEVSALQAQRPGADTRFRGRELRAEYNRLVRSTQNARTPAEIKQTLADRDSFYKAIDSMVQADLDVALAAAKTEPQRQAAYGNALRQAQAPVQAARDRATATASQLETAKEAQAAAARVFQGAQASAASLTGGTPLNPAPGGLSAITAAAAEYRRTTAEVQRLMQQNATDKANLAAAVAERAQALGALQQARYQDAQTGRGISRDLAQSRLPSDDQAGRDAIAERYAKRDLAAARAYKGPDRTRQIRQATTTLNNIRNQAVTSATDQALDDIRAAGELAQARAGNDPVASANAAVGTANQILAHVRGHGGKKAEILRAEAGVVSAQNTLSEAVKSQADAVAQLSSQIAQAQAEGDPVKQARLAQQAARAAAGRATNQQERLQATLDAINANNQLQQAIQDREQSRYEYLQSLTDNPVAQAKLQERADAAALKGTKKGSADYYRALAKQNNDRRATVQARVDDRKETIDFNLQMETISTQTAIAQYQSMLKISGLTKRTRRDILLQIKQLQKDEESQFGDLEIGNIRLPTLYDVRRLGQAGTQGVAVSNTNHVVVQVARGVDMEEVGAQLERITGASVRSGMRSMGAF